MSKEISIAEVKKHRNEGSAWLVIHNDVYDVTRFLNEHPGGPETILEVAGQDATRPFDDVGHSKDARDMLKKYKIGTLPPGEKGKFVDKCCPLILTPDPPKKTWRTYDGSPASSKLKWALLALAGALVIGFVIKKYAT